MFVPSSIYIVALLYFSVSFGSNENIMECIAPPSLVQQYLGSVTCALQRDSPPFPSLLRILFSPHLNTPSLPWMMTHDPAPTSNKYSFLLEITIFFLQCFYQYKQQHFTWLITSVLTIWWDFPFSLLHPASSSSSLHPFFLASFLFEITFLNSFYRQRLNTPLEFNMQNKQKNTAQQWCRQGYK